MFLGKVSCEDLFLDIRLTSCCKFPQIIHPFSVQSSINSARVMSLHPLLLISSSLPLLGPCSGHTASNFSVSKSHSLVLYMFRQFFIMWSHTPDIRHNPGHNYESCITCHFTTLFTDLIRNHSFSQFCSAA